MSGVDELWAAVDRLTQPTNRKVMRDPNPEATAETVDALRRQAAAEKLVTHDLARYSAMRAKHATVPSLWDQAVEALGTSNTDMDYTGGGSVHRTPCDIDLMEIMSQVRESVDFNTAKRGNKPTGTVPQQIRHLASLIVTNEPGHVPLWADKFWAWTRALEKYLQAVQTEPKPRRLRGMSCPECQISRVVHEIDGERVSNPPLIVDFRDGYMRAAYCEGCGATWFRGEQMLDLMDRLEGSA